MNSAPDELGLESGVWAQIRDWALTAHRCCPEMRRGDFGPLVACSVLEYTMVGLTGGRRTAENVVLADDKTTMALVLSGWDGPGRLADDSVFAWKSSGDAHTDQDTDGAGPGNEYPRAYAYAPTECNAHTLTGRVCHHCSAHAEPGIAESQPTADGHSATGSHCSTDRTAAYFDAKPAINSRAHPPPSAHCHGGWTATACPAARRGVGHGGWLCARTFTPG
jgi:hypothetical protein